MKRIGQWRAASVACSGLMLGVFVGVGCERKAPTSAPPAPAVAKHLAILTPHSEAIRDTFGEGFWNWHMKNRGAPVNITWVYRATPQCADYVRESQTPRSESRRYTDVDVMFGGALADFERLAAEGLFQAVDAAEATRGIPEEVQGVATRDAQNRWFATGLSSFGIAYNERACQERGIAPPTTWADLADPRFYGWVTIADPAQSGSHRECMLLVLQHNKGWAAGWPVLARILANARAMENRSADALRQVASGTALVAFAINFDGMALAADSGGAVKYVDPAGATTATPDLVSVLTTAADAAVAKDFVKYVLSEEGQTLWGVVREKRAPYGETLYHYPILPTVYEQHADGLSVKSNPLKEDFGLHLNQQQFTRNARMLNAVVHGATAGANHVRLQQAWRAVIDGGMRPEAVAELGAPPFDEATAATLLEKFEPAESPEGQKLGEEWTTVFAQRFQRLAGGAKKP